jgi:hypothetical protein
MGISVPYRTHLAPPKLCPLQLPVTNTVTHIVQDRQKLDLFSFCDRFCLLFVDWYTGTYCYIIIFYPPFEGLLFFTLFDRFSLLFCPLTSLYLTGNFFVISYCPEKGQIFYKQLLTAVYRAPRQVWVDDCLGSVRARSFPNSVPFSVWVYYCSGRARARYFPNSVSAFHFCPSCPLHLLSLLLFREGEGQIFSNFSDHFSLLSIVSHSPFEFILVQGGQGPDIFQLLWPLLTSVHRVPFTVWVYYYSLRASARYFSNSVTALHCCPSCPIHC